MIGGLTDVGLLRELNEDNFFFKNDKNKYIIAVSDGMGGHKAGEVASKLTVDSIKEFGETCDMYADSDKKIRLAVLEANEKVFNYSCQHKEARGMGATVVVAVVKGNNVVIGNIGDSRAYIADKEKITQITDDHSYVNELLKSGMITAEEARIHPKKNEILKAVGIGRDVFPDIFETTLKKGEMLLLCTDGLTNMLEDNEIFEILSGDESVDTILKKLIDTANERGGTDNITAVLLKK